MDIITILRKNTKIYVKNVSFIFFTIVKNVKLPIFTLNYIERKLIEHLLIDFIRRFFWPHLILHNLTL
ncbi:hypothetical protein BpHYR1_006954 [Brachionus plicatilis]|uniref:Uncharacterized protein n=1 Tax=Brachionus plicatilis TaxID=10195 RepID=A0A3M7RKA3_BRAPC|nr:hypothetical protein BpHYR1_006954 [Brachionus plicatilis]